MSKHKPAQPRITTKEKSAPAYIKRIEVENTQLRESLETTQNQASILQQKCTDLEKGNSVLNERLKGSGFLATVKDLCILVGGAGIGYFIEQNYFVSSSLLLIAFGGMGLYWLIVNYRKR